MTISGQSIRTPPDRANDLFEKLLATSDTAVKTRERLLADLREELEFLATLQEQHLFPVLRRHGMEDLLRDAVRDNEETAALLTALDRMPKNGGEFVANVAALRRAFQQHIRDDRKELLPAVLKVLSDAEAEAIAEKVENEMANTEDTKRVEARRTREQTETAQRTTEDVAVALTAGVEGAQTLARTMQEAVQNGLEAASELTRRSTGQVLQVFGRPDGDPQGLAEQASANLHAVTQSGAALARGVQDISRECLALSQKRWQKNFDGLGQLARCRSVSDLVATQAALIRDNMELTLDNGRRLAELTVQVADEATRTVTAQAEKTAQRVGGAA